MSFLNIKAVATAALLGAAAVYSPAQAFPVFTVNETGFTTNTPRTFNADQLQSSFSSRVVQTIDGGTNPFTETGSLLGQGFTLGGLNIPGGTNLNAAGGYQLFANFQGTGTSTIGVNEVNSTFQTFTFSLYADKGFDQGPRNALQQFAIDGTDVLLATGTLIVGSSTTRFAQNNGDFDVLNTVTLTTDGEAFFEGPRPFYFAIDITGNLNSITPNTPLVPGDNVFIVEGAGPAQFLAVPEPASLALLGIGLVGLGIGSRRRKSA